MKEQGAFGWVRPGIVDRDLGNGDSFVPVAGLRARLRYAAATHEAELAGLTHDAAQAVRKTARAGAIDDDASYGELPSQALAFRFIIDGTGQAAHIVIDVSGKRLLVDQLSKRGRSLGVLGNICRLGR
mgnify:CR=1 FL=1